jgi:hypothetical protein
MRNAFIALLFDGEALHRLRFGSLVGYGCDGDRDGDDFGDGTRGDGHGVEGRVVTNGVVKEACAGRRDAFNDSGVIAGANVIKTGEAGDTAPSR